MARRVVPGATYPCNGTRSGDVLDRGVGSRVERQPLSGSDASIAPALRSAAPGAVVAHSRSQGGVAPPAAEGEADE